MDSASYQRVLDEIYQSSTSSFVLYYAVVIGFCALLRYCSLIILQRRVTRIYFGRGGYVFSPVRPFRAFHSPFDPYSLFLLPQSGPSDSAKRLGERCQLPSEETKFAMPPQDTSRSFFGLLAPAGSKRICGVPITAQRTYFVKRDLPRNSATEETARVGDRYAIQDHSRSLDFATNRKLMRLTISGIIVDNTNLYPISHSFL